jgi:phosphoribosylformylglycinamidine cyclo-ligase
VGHRLIGVASSGLHSNGYSLARKICFERLQLTVDSRVEGLGQSLGEALLTPTKIYAETIRSLTRDLPIHGLAHITGGGIIENLPRTLPKSCKALIRKGSWDIPPIFGFLQRGGSVSDYEMMRTFNNGLGLIAVVPETYSQDVMERLSALNERSYAIGEIVERKGNDAQVEWM